MSTFRPFILIGFCLYLSSCSLLEVSLDSKTTPLSPQELSTRLLTRSYSVLFFNNIEQVADTIQEHNQDNDLLYSYTLLWKISSEETMQQAVYQAFPMAGLVDSLVFTRQMEQFFTEGEGSTLFESDQPSVVQMSLQMTQEITSIAKSLLGTAEFTQLNEFVSNFVAQNPFTNIVFVWKPAYKEWLVATGVEEADIPKTLGTMPEALGDLSDRLSLMSRQTTKLLSWKAELIARNSPISADQLQQVLTSINETSLKFQDFVENNPEYMKTLATEMAIELQPLLDDFNDKAGEKLAMLSDERKALEKMVARERKAIATLVSQERENITTDIDTIAQNTVDKVMSQLTTMVSQLIFYIIALVLVIFFAPFALGFFMGRRFKSAKKP